MIPFSASLGMYAYLRCYGISPMAAIAGSVVYTINPVVYSRYAQGHIAILIGYAVLPFVALVYISPRRRAEESPWHVRDTARGTLLLAIASIGDGHMAYLIGLMIAVYSFLEGVVNRGWLAACRRVASFVVALVAAEALLLPRVFYFVHESYSNWLARITSPVHVIALSKDTDIVNLIRLVGEPGAGALGRAGYYTPGLVTSGGFLVPILSFCSVLLARSHQRRSEALTWVGVAIGGIALASGTRYLPHIYLFLYEKIPLFVMFRESSKFLIIVAFAFSVLAAISVEALIAHLTLTKPRGQWQLAVALALIFLLVIPNRYILKGNPGIASPERANLFPRDYVQLAQWVDDQAGQFRILFVPTDDWIWMTWLHVSRTPLMVLDRHSLVYATPPGYAFASRLLHLLVASDPDEVAGALAVAGVRFVVLWSGRGPSNFVSQRMIIPMAQVKKIISKSLAFEEIARIGRFQVFENMCFSGMAFLLIGGAKEIRRIGGTPPGPNCSMVTFDNEEFAFTDRSVLHNSGGEVLYFQASRNAHFFSAWQRAENVDPSETASALKTEWITGYSYEFVLPGPYAWGNVTIAPTYAISESRSPLSIPIDVERPGIYDLWMRAYSSPRGGILHVGIDDLAPTSVSTRGRYRRFLWVQLGQITVPGGRHFIRVLPDSGLQAIDGFALMAHDTRQLAGVPLPSYGKARHDVVEARRALPSSLLVLAQSFHPEWAMVCGDGTKIRPALVYGFALGFPVPPFCERPHVKFSPQTVLDALFLGSGFGAVILLFIAVVGWPIQLLEFGKPESGVKIVKF
jgi:hypothetical protein